MNKKYIKSLLYPIALVFSLIIAGCADELFDESNGQQGKDRIELSGDIDQLPITRVNDNGFSFCLFLIDIDQHQFIKKTAPK